MALFEALTIEGRFIAFDPNEIALLGEAIRPPDPGLPNPLVPKVLGTALQMKNGTQLQISGMPRDVVKAMNEHMLVIEFSVAH